MSRSVSSTERPTGRSLIVICRTVPVGSIKKRPLGNKNRLFSDLATPIGYRIWGAGMQHQFWKYTASRIVGTLFRLLSAVHILAKGKKWCKTSI